MKLLILSIIKKMVFGILGVVIIIVVVIIYKCTERKED